MDLLKYLLSLSLAIGFIASPLSADMQQQDGDRHNEDLNDQDFDALRDFINTKRTVSLDKKTTNLVFSGDVRTEWRHMTESGRYGTYFGKQRNFRGGNAINYKDLPVSRNDFDIEFNLYLKYFTEKPGPLRKCNTITRPGPLITRKSARNKERRRKG